MDKSYRVFETKTKEYFGDHHSRDRCGVAVLCETVRVAARTVVILWLEKVGRRASLVEVDEGGEDYL